MLLSSHDIVKNKMHTGYIIKKKWRELFMPRILCIETIKTQLDWKAWFSEYSGLTSVHIICLVCQFPVIFPKCASFSIKWECVCLLLFAPDLCPEGSLWRSTHNLWDREYAAPSGWWCWTALRGCVPSLEGLTSKWKLIGKMQLWSPAFPDDARCSPPVCDRLLARETCEARLHPVTAWRRDWPNIRCLSSLDPSDTTRERRERLILTYLLN